MVLDIYLKWLESKYLNNNLKYVDFSVHGSVCRNAWRCCHSCIWLPLLPIHLPSLLWAKGREQILDNERQGKRTSSLFFDTVRLFATKFAVQGSRLYVRAPCIYLGAGVCVGMCASACISACKWMCVHVRRLVRSWTLRMKCHWGWNSLTKTLR